MNLNNLPEIRETATTLAKSALCPSHFKKPEDALFAILKGAELGLPPVYSLSNISVINGKPSLGTDLMVGLAKRSPEWGGMSVEYSDDQESCTVTVRRIYSNGSEDTSTATFTLTQARAAQLVRPGSPWDKYPARMLKHRATSWAIRDAFPDLLAGTYDVDEVQEITAKPEIVSYMEVDSDDPDAELRATLSALHKLQSIDYKSGKLTVPEIQLFNLQWLFTEKTLECKDLDAAKNGLLAWEDFRNDLKHRNIHNMTADESERAAMAALAVVYNTDIARTRAVNKYESGPILIQHLWDKYLSEQTKKLKKAEAKPEPETQAEVESV